MGCATASLMTQCGKSGLRANAMQLFASPEANVSRPPPPKKKKTYRRHSFFIPNLYA